MLQSYSEQDAEGSEEKKSCGPVRVRMLLLLDVAVTHLLSLCQHFEANFQFKFKQKFLPGPSLNGGLVGWLVAARKDVVQLFILF